MARRLSVCDGHYSLGEGEDGRLYMELSDGTRVPESDISPVLVQGYLDRKARFIASG